MFVGVCHAGPVSDGERVVKLIKDFGSPAIEFIGPTAYAAQQTLFDDGAAARRQNYWRSNFRKELGDDVIEAIVARADELPRPGTLILLEHMGGAVTRSGEHETAFANRGAMYNLPVIGAWTDPALNDSNIAWIRNFSDELRSFATGGAYVNYMAGESSENPAVTRGLG